MLWTNSVLAALLLAYQQHAAVAQSTWPASTDELEDLLYLNTGYRARGFADPVTPCSIRNNRTTAAEWIRTAFHDMATGNVYSGAGGLDGSIMFELATLVNRGPAFRDALTTFSKFYSSRLSISEIIAASVYTATRACGGPIIPVRGGRVDAIGTSDVGGIPEPQNAIGTFRNQFLRMGYGTDADMITFVACGHTLGGVNSSTNPLVVAPAVGFLPMDSSPATFDNKIATEYVSSTTNNPLVGGISVNSRRNSDKVVFQADTNTTIRALADTQTFAAACQRVFQQMIEVVPRSVTLTSPVTPYDVKPYDIQLTLIDGGSKLRFTGDIRVRTTSTSVTRVQLIYKDRTGTTVSTPIDTIKSGEASGFDDQFSFFGFSADIPVATSISSFNVLVTAGGTSVTYDNSGNGYKVDDTILFQSPQSCVDASGKMFVVAAVRNGSPSPTLRVVVANSRASDIPVPTLSTATSAMATQSAAGVYALYSASYTFSGTQAQSAEFGVFAGSASDNYKKAARLGASCAPFDVATPTPSLSTQSSTPTSTPSATSSTSSAATPPSTAFAFQGCYTDPNNPRPLSAAATAGNDMTIEKCASFCSAYQFFGAEYSSECYCGNVLGSNSVEASLSDCNMPCSGNANELCGAGSRLSFYKNLKYKAAVNPVIQGYKYAGCYSEASGGVRALSDTATASDVMTVDTCAGFCNGAKFFGVEYGKECYCGNRLNDGSDPQPETDCSMLCPGNATELCGAGNRLNIYERLATSTSTSSPTTSSSPSSTPAPTPSSDDPKLSGYTYYGCLTDGVTTRLLTGKASSSNQNNYSSCASFCTGFQYFGVEYGAECYCGDVLNPVGDASPDAKRPNSECSMACAGDSTAKCGGADRITVFKNDAVDDVPKNPVVDGYTYVGCHTDSVAARVLQGGGVSGSDMTIEKCRDVCQGSKFFGTEYGAECHCGEEFANPSEVVDESECAFVCGGDKLEFCGAGNRLSLYRRN